MIGSFETMLKPADLPTEPKATSKQLHQLVPVWIVAAVLVGFVVRAIHIFATDFPLNDGGLFYVMVQELQRTHYRLPDFSSYNSLGIPFAYPPLGFYVAGFLNQITPLNLIDVFRLLPLVVTTLTIVAFACLARDLLGSNKTAIAAVFAFALIPRSFIWLLMGGGVTRSFGFLFAILALHQIYLMYSRQSWRFFIPATLFAGLTVMSHLGTAPFLVFSIALFFLAYGRHKHGILSSLALGIGSLAITAPWWATVVASHGLEPFLAANATGSSVFTDGEARRATLGWLAHLGIGGSTGAGGSTAEPLFPLLGMLALLGALYSVSRKMLLIPAWWITIIVLDTRAGATYAVVPVAMLAGLGMMHVLLPALTSGRAGGAALPNMKSPVGCPPNSKASWKLLLRSQWFPIVLFSFLLGYAILGAVSTKLVPAAETRNLGSLSKEERAAMHWAATSTSPSSRFLVLPESPWVQWWVSRSSEWFPVLAERTSIATVQGSEWLPNQAFAKQRHNFKLLRKCALDAAVCLDDWSRETGITFTHVYIPRPTVSAEDSYLLCCELLIKTLKEDPRYGLMYAGPGAVIFARR